MADRTVRCAKLGLDLTGLEQPPFPSDLGRRIFESVSRRAWDLWQEQAAALSRERGLSMGRPEDRKLLLQEMERFLFTPAAAEAPAEAPTEADEGTVLCVKTGKRLPALKKPPFPGPLGQRIFENVSEPGFKLWKEQSTILMNHHNLSMADPEARRFLMKEMEEFFFGRGARMPEDWVPPTADGKGGGKGAPSPKSK